MKIVNKDSSISEDKGTAFRVKCENMLTDVVKYYKDNKKKIPELAIIEGDLNPRYSNYLIEVFSNKGIHVNFYRVGVNAELAAQINCKDALNKKYVIFLDGIRHYKFMDTWEYESDINEELGGNSLNKLFYNSNDVILPYKAAAVFQLLHDYDINIFLKNISIIGFGFNTLSLAILLSKVGSVVSIVHPGTKGDFNVNSSDVVINNIFNEFPDYHKSKNCPFTSITNISVFDTIYIKGNPILTPLTFSIRTEYEKGMIIYNFIRKLSNRANADCDFELENYLKELYSPILTI